MGEKNKMVSVQESMKATVGGSSEKITTSTASAQSSVINAGCAVVTVDVDTFFRRGSNPTAVSNGTDQILLANNSYRITDIPAGEKLAFITVAGTGNAYITPGA